MYDFSTEAPFAFLAFVVMMTGFVMPILTNHRVKRILSEVQTMTKNVEAIAKSAEVIAKNSDKQ